MNKRTLGFLFLLLLNMYTVSIHAQQQYYTNTSLKKVLSALEKTYDVKFSYSDKLINTKKISLVVSDQSIDQLLISLQKKTNLIFQQVTKRYIIISEKNINTRFTACGYLVDKISLTPLRGATVITTNKVNGIHADEKGYFQLYNISKTDSIQVSFLGYKTKVMPILSLLKKPCSTIELDQYSSVLDEVLITDYLTDGISKQTDGSVQISPNKLGILPGLTEPDVLQSIQLLPGIQSPNETASGIHIRGGTPDQNLVLFDGIKMYNSAHFFGMISAFNPYITKKIKVYRSGVGAEYGNHVSGVIDIQTNNEVPDRFSGGLGSNFTHADGYLKIPISKQIGFSISGRRSITDILNTSTFNKLSRKVFQNTIISQNQRLGSEFFEANNRFYFFDFNTKLTANLSEKDKLILSQLSVKNKLDYKFKVRSNVSSTRDVLQINNEGINARWEKEWSSKTHQKTSFYYSNFDFNYNYIGIATGQVNIRQTSKKYNIIRDYGFKTIIENRFKPRHNIGLGYEFVNKLVSYTLGRNYSNAPNFDYDIHRTRHNNTHAVFGKYSYTYDDIVTFNFGLRLSHFSATKKTFFTPRIYGKTKLFPNLWAKASFEVKQQNISQLLEFTTTDFGLENQIWVLADNEGVPILKSNQYTFGLLFKKNNWTLDLDFYRKKIKGITSLTKGFNRSSNFFSQGNGVSRGIDLLVKKKWGNYSSWVSYSFGNTDFTFDDINNGDPFAGNFDIKHSLQWSHNIKMGSYDFSLGWSFRTGIPYTKPTIDAVNNVVLLNTINGERLPNYHKLDFSATYSFHFDTKNRWKGKIGISLLNIYERNNILKRNYGIFNDNGTLRLRAVDNISLGFTPNVVFRLNF